MASSDRTFSSDSGRFSDLISVLRDRSPKLAMGIAAVQLAWPMGKRLRTKVRDRAAYTIKVLGTDGIYDELHEWVLGLLPPQQQRALVAWTSLRNSSPALYSDSSPTPTPPNVRLRYDGSKEQTITLDQYKILVLVADGESATKNSQRKLPEIIFTTHSLAAQQRLLAEIANVARKRDRKPQFRMLNRWGDWENLEDLPDRTLESVILPDGQLERLLADVERFLSSEQDYVRRCIPWHRGHLYEGPPGSGKTSVARAIASHFKMDIWYLPLADVTKDCDLLAVINRIGPRSMLLLEDADVYHAATQRDDDSGVTLSGLLNALDGIATPHGLLTVLTTNTPEVLDKALVRPGRIDLIEHFLPVNNDQVTRLLSRWYGHPISVPTGLSGLSAAEVIEACKRHDDPKDALSDLVHSVS